MALYYRKKLKKEIIKLNGRNNGDKLNRTRKEKKEVKIKNIMEQILKFLNYLKK